MGMSTVRYMPQELVLVFEMLLLDTVRRPFHTKALPRGEEVFDTWQLSENRSPASGCPHGREDQTPPEVRIHHDLRLGGDSYKGPPIPLPCRTHVESA